MESRSSWPEPLTVRRALKRATFVTAWRASFARATFAAEAAAAALEAAGVGVAGWEIVGTAKLEAEEPMALLAAEDAIEARLVALAIIPEVDEAAFCG